MRNKKQDLCAFLQRGCLKRLIKNVIAEIRVTEMRKFFLKTGPVSFYKKKF